MQRNTYALAEQPEGVEITLELKGPKIGVRQPALTVKQAEPVQDFAQNVAALATALSDNSEAPWAGSAGIYDEAWRLDCGAVSDYLDPFNGWWVKDEDFFNLYRWGYAGNQSDTAFTSDPIAGTDIQAIYQTNRWGDIPYKLDMPNGEYAVTLMFAETYFTAADRRVFDVALEGETLWHNMDIYSWSSGHDIAMNLTADISVSDGCLDITFPVIYRDLPLISGIKVEALNVPDDAFLDFIQKKMFWFFCTESNSTTGLVKWGENNWAPGSGNVSSIASDGYALSAYTIGLDRGWMTEDDAYQRTVKMLDSFDTRLENVHGFWYHYVQMDDGQRADGSEVSTVDSSLFIMGALQAGEYFKSTHPDVAIKAKALYERMDWTWFTGVSSGDTFKERFVNMGWKPENDGFSYVVPSNKAEEGYYCNSWWDSYSETIFVDLLAIGSPTHPIAIDAWRDTRRNRVDAFGYSFIQEPPLFTHQYQHLYFDLTGKHDAYADYFLNSQLATLANRQTCIDAEYETNVWGLTACGGADGKYNAYGGYPGGWNDGTVAPTAAITSIIFTQDESIDAARYMYFKYKDFIWGRHGFCDSFNIGKNFRDWSANALDNGAMILGIENFRTGSIMDTFMENQYMRDAMTLVGFIDNLNITASSDQNSELSAAFAFDGNPATRWSSRLSNTPQWLEYDFGAKKTFDKVTIDWEYAYARSYKIQVSDNRISWTDVFSTGESDGSRDEVIFAPEVARYVRIYATERGTEWAYSIYGVKIESTFGYCINTSETIEDWYKSSGDYASSGAAACQTILNYIREGAGASPLSGQSAVYEYAKGPSSFDASELTPDEIDRALGHFDPYDITISGWADAYDSLYDGNPYQGYNYSVETYDPDANPDAMNDYLRDICHWIAYPVTLQDWWRGGALTARPYSPAVVPLYGSYEHWAVITGFTASGNPCPDPVTDPFNTPDIDVYGLWIYSPGADGTGESVYMSAADAIVSYLKPIMLTGDKYYGLLLQIAEPPLI